MKKKLLFIMNNLRVGGAEKALVSLLQTIDYSQYEVDLYLFEKEGLFLDGVPQQVTILPAPQYYGHFEMPVIKAVTSFLKKGNLKLALARIGFGVVYKTVKIQSQREQRSWRFLSMALWRIPKRYDAAIGYLEKRPNYFCIDKTNADIKIGFIHNDYDKLQMLPEIDLPYFKKFDRIFTISEQCETILKGNFPSVANRISIMYNIVSPSTLQQLAKEPIDFEKKGITLVSVGRLNTQKGFDMAIDACKTLVDQGLDVYWYILGEGEQRNILEAKIKIFGLEQRFVLLGIRENPYPYVAVADLYVQPSRFEGKSIAIDEAKILGKPIVVTNFPSIVDQITHSKNGWIVDMAPDAIAGGIAQLIQNVAVREKLQANLASEKLGTQQEIDKLYAVINRK
jgi:glycosyltransferase involved in cell wall biosynthesis